MTQLDLRDNRLACLDLSSACSLETLHCQRNQLGALTLSGFALRALHASSNRELAVCLSACLSPPVCLSACLTVCPFVSLSFYRSLFLLSLPTPILGSVLSLRNTHSPAPTGLAADPLSLPTGLTTINIYPVPNQLTHMDLSR